VAWIDKAVQRLGPASTLAVNVSRKPFFLYPGGVQSERQPSKWGERVSLLYSPSTWQHIKQLGAQAGYSFNFDSELSDTMDSHRLVLFAETQGKQKELVQELSRRYFEDGVPLADRANLLDVAAKYDVHGAAEYLDSGAGRQEVCRG
jgi:predicted DsbA family dithiol-disulfide isomerase